MTNSMPDQLLINTPEQSNSATSPVKQAWFWVLVVLISLCATFIMSRDYDLRIAMGGFTPVGWTYQLTNPAGFLHNFPSGTEQYDKSLILHLYPWLYKTFGILPEQVFPVWMGFEILGLAVTAVLLIRVLFPTATFPVYLLAMLLFSTSSAKNISLSNFFQPFIAAQFYNFADILRIFAILACLQGRYWLMALFLAVAATFHPIYAVIGSVFIVATLIISYREVPFKKLLGPLALFLAITGAWFLSAYQQTLASKQMPLDIWHQMTLLGSFHWYPVSMGIFSFAHQLKFFPMLGFLLAFAYSLRFLPVIRPLDRRIFAGMLAMVLLTAAGIIISVVVPSQELIKLALHRSDDLFYTFALPYICFGFWQLITTAKLWQRILALLVLLSAFYLIAPYPMALCLLLILPAVFETIRKKYTLSNILVTSIAGIIVCIMLGYAVTGIITQAHVASYLGLSSLQEFHKPLRIFFKNSTEVGYWQAMIWVIFITGLLYMARHQELSKRLFISLMLLIFLVSSCFSAFRIRKVLCHWDPEVAGNFKSVQTWAEHATRFDSLFMVDPTINYAWRDLSHRSSFGSVHELLHTGWLYSSSASVFDEGMRRFNVFKLNISSYYHKTPATLGFAQMSDDVGQRFYGWTDQERTDVSKQFGIDYFVLDRTKMLHPSQLPVAYENKYFVVLKAPTQ